MSMTPEQLYQLANVVDGYEIYPNTTKDCKVGGMVAFAEHASRQRLSRGDHRIFSQLYKEPLVEGLFGSARHKAWSMKIVSPENSVGAGADGTFSVYDGEKWVQLHQLGRDTNELSQGRIIEEYHQLKKYFVYPSTENKRVYLAWSHGLSYVNGDEQNLGDLLLVRAAPMDLKYFQNIYSESIANGDVLKINARFPAFESFSTAGLVETIGFMPHWAVRQQLSILPFMVKSNEQLEEIGRLEVVTTMPWTLLGFDEAQDYARKLGF